MTVNPGVNATPVVLGEYAGPTTAVALGTAATTIFAVQVPAISVGVVDIQVIFGVLTLANTATAAVSYTLSANVGAASASNLNGQSPNGYLAAASAGGSIVTSTITGIGLSVSTAAAFTVGLYGLGSATGVNAYLNTTIVVLGYLSGSL
jgi:hypothetical protein